jgi:hypothetical protein
MEKKVRVRVSFEKSKSKTYHAGASRSIKMEYFAFVVSAIAVAFRVHAHLCATIVSLAFQARCCTRQGMAASTALLYRMQQISSINVLPANVRRRLTDIGPRPRKEVQWKAVLFDTKVLQLTFTSASIFG